MDFHGQAVSYFLDDTGNPWWPAQNPCRILGHDASNVSHILGRLDSDEKELKVTTRKSNGAAKREWCVNEAGLYSLILWSEKDEAKVFKRWITHEVLPSIRRTGSYLLTPDKLNAHFLGPQPLSIEPGQPKFELTFFQAVCQVFGQRVPTNDKHSSMCAWFIRKYIYDAMPPSVFAEMDRINPVIDARGRRKLRLWQLLKFERISDFLLKRIEAVYAILKTCTNLGKAVFKKLMVEHDKQRPLEITVAVQHNIAITVNLPFQPSLFTA
jgi:hypothetical protein